MNLPERITFTRNQLKDELSKKVFDAWVHVSDINSHSPFLEHLRSVTMREDQLIHYKKFLGALKDESVEKFIFGAGMCCKSIVEGFFQNAINFSGPWSGIVDNYVSGMRYGLPTINFEKFVKDHKGALLLNSVGAPPGREIAEQCREAGLFYLNMFELLKGADQYFDLISDLGLISRNEVFVHAGCDNGSTQKHFIEWFGDTYAKMFTFEPNANQFAIARENLKALRGIEIVQAGLSDRSGVARFSIRGLSNSRISDTGSEEIRVVALDDYLQSERVTFIALDIEGNELAALRGAERTIKGQKPKLAISVYHKPEDIWEIPALIKDFNHEYELYLRHYNLIGMSEAILYAV